MKKKQKRKSKKENKFWKTRPWRRGKSGSIFCVRFLCNSSRTSSALLTTSLSSWKKPKTTGLPSPAIKIYVLFCIICFLYKLIGFKCPPFPISPAPRYSVMLSTSSLLMGNPTVWLIAVKTTLFASLLKGSCCQNHEFPTCTLPLLDGAWYFPPCSWNLPAPTWRLWRWWWAGLVF